MLRPHVTQIVFVVGEGGLTLWTGPLRLRGGLTAAARGRVTPRSPVVPVGIVLVFVLLLVLLLPFPPPVLPVGVVRFPRGFGFGAGGARRVGWRRGGVGGIGRSLRLFG